jgi:hypothetical protein
MNKTFLWMTVCLMILVTGCKSGQKADNAVKEAPSKAKPVALSTQDFVADGTQNAATPAYNAASVTQTTDTKETADPALNTSQATAATYFVAGMVGQVNGRPIYARSIFKDVHERLTDLGKRLPAAQFKQQASALLQGRLKQIVMDALILGEAENQLTEQNQQGLLHFLKEERKKLIRELGRGSEELANERSRISSGLTLDQRISEKRNQVIVQNYLREKLWPKINVSRKDIERYYHDHFEDFNPPEGRTIHMLRTSEENVANQIDKELANGRDFLDIAGDNVLNPRDWEKKGLFGTAIKGNPFGNDALNDATLKLKEGENTPRMKVGSMYTWVYIAKISQGETHTLREVQLDIERILKQQQYNRYTEEYQKRLLDEGSYNDLEEMHKRLMEICMSVYAAQP